MFRWNLYGTNHLYSDFVPVIARNEAIQNRIFYKEWIASFLAMTGWVPYRWENKDMQIKVNNLFYDMIEESVSISQILDKMNYTYPIIVVEFMSRIIDKQEFDSIFLRDGDEISIMHVFAGG